MEPPLLLKVEDAARRLGLSRTKTYELIARRELAAVRIGGRLRVPERELNRWVTRLHRTA